MRNQIIIALPIFMLCQVSSAFADDSVTRHGSSEYPNAVSSIEGYSIGETTADSLLLQAQHCLHAGDVNRAIKLCQLALNKDYNDCELHQLYAQALQKKLQGQPADERDPELFNKCVKEWVFVLRNEYGDEQGMSWHGLSVPGLSHEYEDSDRGGVARAALKQLTGSTPRMWETDARYLKRVGKPSTTTVDGKVVDDGKKAHKSNKAKVADQ